MRRKTSPEFKAFIDSMPKYTASQKIIIKAINMIDLGIKQEDRELRLGYLMYAKGLLAAFTFEDDEKRRKV